MKSPQGFTLVETLLAVLILSLSIAGPLTIASKGITATMIAKDQFTAFFLAQDAMEYVRFARDSACLAAVGGTDGCPSASWLSGLSSCLSTVSPAGCYVDSIQSTVLPCTTTCPTLNYNSTNRYFSYSASDPATPQRFIRTVSITNTTADEAVVTVTVIWNDLAGATRTPIVVRESIFLWQ